VKMWAGVIWLIIRSGGRLLWTRQWILWFHNYNPSDRLLLACKWLWSIEWFVRRRWCNDVMVHDHMTLLTVSPLLNVSNLPIVLKRKHANNTMLLLWFCAVYRIFFLKDWIFKKCEGEEVCRTWLSPFYDTYTLILTIHKHSNTSSD
jgi:hypothetical protein